MVPLIAAAGTSLLQKALPSLIEGGVGLLGGLFSGLSKSAAEKRSFKNWEKSRGVQTSDLDKLMAKRYRTASDLPTIDPVVKKLLLGRLSQYITPEQGSSWGIDFSDVLSRLGGAGEGTRAPMNTKQDILRRRATPGMADEILNKYQLGGTRGGPGGGPSGIRG